MIWGALTQLLGLILLIIIGALLPMVKPTTNDPSAGWEILAKELGELLPRSDGGQSKINAKNENG